MKIWFLITQKGGAGKTTLATNLAVCAGLEGKNVMLADLDPQETAVKWWQSREDEKGVISYKVPQNIEKIRQVIEAGKQKKFDLIIFDTVGQDTILHNSIIDLATFCIIPCQPSLPDIRAVKSTISLVEKKNISFSFVITRCPPVGQEFEKTNQGLSAHGLVCPFPTIERKAYKNSYSLGLGVVEYDKKDKASEEMINIYNWIKKTEIKLSKKAIV